MTFDEILEQVIALLKRQGRVSYRALKRRFGIDDDYIADLKEEISYVHESAVEADDRGFTWTGATEEPPVTTSQPSQPEPHPVVEQVRSTPVKSTPTERQTPEAERRQLTVMFCDLVGSTSLSSALDPEDLRDVIRDYQATCTEVIQRYDGHVAQLLGDGLLVYFGYPQAHEDDAQRAIYTGLGIVEAIGTLNNRLEKDKGIRLEVRLGIHTGLVVVGDMGGEGRQEQLALGETPNVAARIQGLAEPDTVVISAETYRLTDGFFECESLGEHDLRGVTEPVVVYRVLGDSGVQSRLDVATTRGLTPLVGREREVGLLLDRWVQAKDGQGQVILLSGEAGIGKSRLVQVIKNHVSEDNHARLECRSLPYFTNSALSPIIDMLQRTLRFQTDDTSEQKLEKLTQNLSQYRLPLDESVPLFASLLSLPVSEDRYPPLSLSPQRQRQKTLEAIVAIMLELAERKPVLFILEDLHWTDPTTLEFLELLIDQTPTASLCLLATCRPEFQPPWSHRSYLTQMTLNRLSRNQVESIATQVAGGKTLPSEAITQLVEKTDGVPLYVEEMVKAVLETGVLKEMDEQYELSGSISTLSIPATLQDSLMARLDRLVTAKGVAQMGATIGRQFGYELLQAVAQVDEPTLQRELGRLVDAELVYQRGLPPDATDIFKHALIQDTAYESLLRSTRQRYHHRIAEVLEARFPDTVAAQPELMAHHYTEAGLAKEAIGYWHNAGQKAAERSANVEAISHLNKGLELLNTLPCTAEHLQQELDIQITLGRLLIAVKGYAHADVGSTYTRARDLCQQVDEPIQTVQSLWGLSIFHMVRKELQIAYDMGKQCLSYAQHLHVTENLIGAHMALGAITYNLGGFLESREHLEKGLALYHSSHHDTLVTRYGQDVGISCYNYVTQTLWTLGYPNQALAMRHEMVAISQELSHPYSSVLTLFWAARLHLLRREPDETLQCLDTLMPLASEQSFTFITALSMVIRGWVFVAGERVEEGINSIHQGVTSTSYSLSLLAEAYAKTGNSDKGLLLIDKALVLVDEMGDRVWEAELHRLKGQLLLQQSSDNHTEAETCFQQAISIAQNQSAKSWELRAATSLAKLWQSQGKRDKAYTLLESVYSWFSEGFDTADLKDAKALLDELESR